MPATEQAALAGTLTPAHVDVLAAARTEATAAAFARDEALLVGHASSLSYKGFAKAVAYWRLRADPDSADGQAGKDWEGRAVSLVSSVHGCWLGKMTFDAINGAIVAEELHRREAELLAADWAEARARLGEAARATDLCRTSAQRRADALVEMARRSGACADGARLPVPLFSVLVGYETLRGAICEIEGGGVVSPTALFPWLSEAELERAVFAPDGRVECSERGRFFTGATRRAIELRDQECTHDCCDIPANRCEADHVVPYSAGGPTIQANGRMGCRCHNKWYYRQWLQRQALIRRSEASPPRRT